MTKNVVLKYKLHIKKERVNQIGRWIVWQLCYLCSYIKDPKEQYYQGRMNTILGSKTSLVAQMVKCLLTMLETRIQSLGWEDLLEKEMATHSVFLPEKSHGRRKLVGYSPWGRKESDTTSLSLSLGSKHLQKPIDFLNTLIPSEGLSRT